MSEREALDYFFNSGDTYYNIFFNRRVSRILDDEALSVAENLSFDKETVLKFIHEHIFRCIKLKNNSLSVEKLKEEMNRKRNAPSIETQRLLWEKWIQIY
jgi:hypothetical protein